MTDCKYMRSKYNYTPCDYDLYFDYTEVASNINLLDAVDLAAQLKQVTPLGKIIHLHLETGEKKHSEQVNIHSELRMNGMEVQLI